MPPLRDVNEDAASMCSGDPLSIYSYNKQKNRWTRTSYARTTTDTEGNFKCAASPPSQIKILTWNVDFFSPNAAERLDCILSYIQHTLFSCSEDQHAPEPCALLLQEVESEVLSVLLASSWLREHFQMTPISNFNWPNRSHYGCIMIVSKDISIVRARNLVFKGSHQSRAALIMDFLLSAPLSEEVASNEVLKGQQGEGNCNSVKGASEGAILGEDVESPRPNPFVIFRVANVHLESLPQGADERRRQLALVAQALQARDGYGEQNLLGGMVCGDMNSICASDRDLHLEVGLIDAHLSDVSTGAAEDDMDAFTWGFQPAGTYPPGRLDKILHTRAHIPAAENSRSVVFTVDAPTRVGVGLKIKDDDYASSHVGLSTRLTLNSVRVQAE